MSEDARRAREEALGRLVEQGTLTADQARAVSGELDRAEARSGVRWAEVVGYIGGGLVLAAVATFAATSWEDLGVVARVGLLAAAVPVLALAGVVMAGGPKALAVPRDRVPKVRRRIGGTLFALASVAAMFAVQVLVTDGLALWEDDLLIAGAVGLAVALGGYALLRSAPGVVAAWAMSLITAGGVLNRVHEALDTGGGGIFYGGSGAMALNGTGYILLGAVWVAVALAGPVAERGTAIGLGAATAVTAAEFLPSPWHHAGVAVLAVALLGLYAWRRTGALLVFGIIATTIAVPQVVWEVTDGEVSAAAILAIAGAVLLAASGTGVRLHRSGRSDPPSGGGGQGGGENAEGPVESPAPDEGDGSSRRLPRVDPRDPDERL
ncbi:DUF2157 domain-containing protein [Nocardiopsis baichengensis]|uniref:DUF2157 domain-containing protein n=1 Tax=Nocardiopsis baichengensis TaxID=280240 RepID=UPI00034815B7|nr:DUF2157 domain-containing protein [Nocardiopsis baichengensis]